MFPFRSAKGVVLVAAMVCLGGCGSVPTGQVRGKVVLEERPVAGAELVFQSVDNAQEQYFGVSGDDGAYQVSYREHDGLPVGRYQVLITRYTLSDGKPLPPGEQGEVLKGEGKAVAHVVRFEQEISEGAQSVDFELSQGTPAEASDEWGQADCGRCL